MSNALQKVSNGLKKVSNAQEKVSNDFGKYISLLQKAGTTDKFIVNIEMVYNKYEMTEPFGQADIQEWLGCSKSKATNVMKAMREGKIVEKVKGFGPGKYKFIQL